MLQLMTGNILNQNKNPEEASLIFNKMLQKDGKNPWALVGKGKLFSRKFYENFYNLLS